MRLLSLSKNARIAACLVKNRVAGEGIFCNIKEERNRLDLPMHTVKKILDTLSDSSVALVSFEGGEPLLRNDIAELLSYARSKQFYLLFTTSEHALEKYPMREYARYIDFLHISIDEGHNNLRMFERLAEFQSYGSQLAVQVVVTRDTLPALAEKAAQCHRHGASMVIMPAVHMNRTGDFFPDMDAFTAEIRRLKKLYPALILTPDGYGAAVRNSACSSESIIIDSDGRLFYPCHIRETKGPDLSVIPLMTYLTSPEAVAARRDMRACRKQCGWFQYFSIRDYTSVTSAAAALWPAISKALTRLRRTSSNK